LKVIAPKCLAGFNIREHTFQEGKQSNLVCQIPKFRIFLPVLVSIFITSYARL